jgi:nicotinamidase-related amidase
MNTTTSTTLPLPDFFDPAQASEWAYTPDQQAIFERAVEWRERFRIAPAAEDRARVHLLLIDAQKDFCLPEGALFVGGRSGRGAIDDNERTARFIYQNLDRLTQISCTLDTHHPYQIFSPAFWLGEDGRPPAPHQEISVADIRAGRLRPNPALAAWFAGGDVEWLNRQAEAYCDALERAGRYKLYLWPPHCIAGSDGHALAGVIHAARMFHSYARLAPAPMLVKGEAPLTEFYSAVHPEVATAFDGRVLAEPNHALLEVLESADALLVAGQAASHCVRTTLEDVLGHEGGRHAHKIYILRDCMTSIAVPDATRPGDFAFDFTPQTDAAHERFAAAGMHIVDSTVPMGEWLAVGNR